MTNLCGRVLNVSKMRGIGSEGVSGSSLSRDSLVYCN